MGKNPSRSIHFNL